MRIEMMEDSVMKEVKIERVMWKSLLSLLDWEVRRDWREPMRMKPVPVKAKETSDIGVNL